MISTEDLMKIKCALGIQEKNDCTWEEDEAYRRLLIEHKPLPKGVQCVNPDSEDENKCFCKMEETTLSREELEEYVQYKQLKSLITIKNCVVFFTVLTIISLAASLVTGLILLCE